MGGFGSGRWGGARPRRQADGSLRLPAPPAWMVAAGSGLWRWPKGFRVFCDIEDGAAVLRYPAGRGFLCVGLESTPANLGGSRYWWRCPDCSRRSLKLYLPSRSDSFACRVCHDLSYESAQASRSGYYELFKSSARQFYRGPQGAYLRRVCGPVTATHFREGIRAGMGGFTVAPFEGKPERYPANETQRDAVAGRKSQNCQGL